jgi:ABC-type transporter Mla subunit MlaD
MTLSVDADLPVKMDSRVKIMSMTPLGDNHVEVLPGTPGSADAPTGTRLPSDAYIDLNTLMAQVQEITPQAQELLTTLNDRVVELKVTLGRVNDLLNAENRSNLSAVLADSRGLIQENRPQVKSTLEHLNDVSGRLQPVLDDLRKTSATANQALDHVDALIGEDRPDILTSVNDVQTSLKHPMMLATAFQESSLPIARRLLTECLTKKNERK